MELGSMHDLQVINIGDAEFMFIPGELFIEAGIEMLNGAAGKYPFIATLANGNGAYLFTKACAEKFPNIMTTSSIGWGYYEICRAKELD
jgi:hypothetical protein